MAMQADSTSTGSLTRALEAQLAELLRTIANALGRGFVPRTLSEHHALAMRGRSDGEGPERAPAASDKSVARAE